jgi:hypothetical protein
MNALKLLGFGALMGAVLASNAASAATYTVYATDDIFLAGQTSVPSGFPASGSYDGGVGAGTLPVAISVTAGETFSLAATGVVSCCNGSISNDPNGPNGGGLGGGTSISGYGNVGAYTSGTELALLGVFNSGPTPWTAFQVGASDTVKVPTGASILYLGFADAFGFSGAPGTYNDNTGSLAVTASVPEPSTWAMMLLGFAGLSFAGYRRAVRKSGTAAQPA